MERKRSSRNVEWPEYGRCRGASPAATGAYGQIRFRGLSFLPLDGKMSKIAIIKVAVVALITCVVSVARAQQPPIASDPAAGRAFALRVCAACHVVSDDQPYPPILRQPASSFSAIANKPGTTPASLRAFLSVTHATLKTPYNMPNPELTDQQTAAVISYILSLRRPS